MGKKPFLSFGLVLFFLLGFTAPTSADSIYIPAFEFHYPEDDNAVEYDSYRYLSLLQCPSYKPKMFYAQVMLPDKAQITSMVIFYEDTSWSGNMELNMSRWNMYSENAQVMASFSSSGYSPSYMAEKVFPIKYSIVNNKGYIYRVRVEFSQATPNVILYGVKINYH